MVEQCASGLLWSFAVAGQKIRCKILRCSRHYVQLLLPCCLLALYVLQHLCLRCRNDLLRGTYCALACSYRVLPCSHLLKLSA